MQNLYIFFKVYSSFTDISLNLFELNSELIFNAVNYNIPFYCSETQTDNARALPNEVHKTKDALSVQGQFDDAVENGKTLEKGQGDAPTLVTPVATEN